MIRIRRKVLTARWNVNFFHCYNYNRHVFCYTKMLQVNVNAPINVLPQRGEGRHTRGLLTFLKIKCQQSPLKG